MAAREWAIDHSADICWWEVLRQSQNVLNSRVHTAVLSARSDKHTHSAQSSGGVGGGAKINYKIHHCVAQEKWEVWEILIYRTPTGENSFSRAQRQKRKAGPKKGPAWIFSSLPFSCKASSLIVYNNSLSPSVTLGRSRTAVAETHQLCSLHRERRASDVQWISLCAS